MTRSVVCGLALWSGPALGATYVVDPAGTADFQTVTDAVLASSPGDEIHLEAGDYSSEPVVVLPHELLIASVSGPNPTTAPLLEVAAGADVVLRGLTVPCDASLTAPGVDILDGAIVELDNMRTAMCSDSFPRVFFRSNGATLWVHDSNFLAEALQFEVTGTDLTIENSVFVGQGLGAAIDGLGLPGLLPSTTVIRDTSFDDYNVVGSSWSAPLYLVLQDALEISNSTFSDNAGVDAGALLIGLSPGAVIQGSAFERNSASSAGAVYATDSSLAVESTEFRLNVGVNGPGGLHFEGTAADHDLTVDYSSFTEDSSTLVAGALAVDSPGDLLVRGSLFCGSAGADGSTWTLTDVGSVTVDGTALALGGGGFDGVQVYGSGVHSFTNTTFAGFPDSAIRMDGAGASLELDECIFHDISNHAVVGFDTTGGVSPLVGTGDRNNTFAVLGDLGSGEFDTTTFAANGTTVDPMFQNYIDQATTTCADINLWLDPASPLRDLGTSSDLDGTDSDIGAFGGAWANLVDGDGDNAYEDIDCDDADETLSPNGIEIPYDGIDQDCDGFDLLDADGDGHDGPVGVGPDCDDADATIYPGAPDTWYDGIDSDCAGDDDFDQDGDGHRALEHAGDDCSDTDPDIHPGVPEIPDDGIDQDCDGVDDKTGVGTGTGTGTGGGGGDGDGCGCSTSSGAPVAAFLPLLLLLASRRRAG